MPRTRTLIRSSARLAALLVAALLLSLAPAARAGAPAHEEAEGRGLEREARLDYAAAFDAFAEAFAAAIGDAPAEPGKEAEVYLHKLHFLAERTGRYADLAALLERARARGLAPSLDAKAAWKLSRARLAAGDVEGAERALDGIGLLTRFAIAGPFENERGGGFATAYGPEGGPIDLAARYAGKSREVGWTAPEKGAAFGRVDLDALLRPNDEALAYAVTYVRWEGAPATLGLLVGSDEGLKAWWNGDLVLSRDVNRVFEPDQDAATVLARPGWNRLLLKVTERKGAWAFAARLVDARGRGLALAHDPRVPAEAAAAGAAPAGARPEGAPPSRGAVDAYAAEAAAGRLGARDWFRYGYLLLRRHAHDESEHPDREALRKAAALAPKSAVYRTYLSFVEAQTGEYSVNREENARRLALEEALALDPAHARAAHLLGEYYLRSMRMPERARVFAERALEASGGAPEAAVLLAEVEERLGLDARAAARLLALEKDARATRSGEALRAIARAKLRVGDAPGATRLVERALALDAADDGARDMLVDARKTAGDLDGAIALLSGRVRLSPFDVAARLARAALLSAADRHEECLAAIDEALAIAPEDEGAIGARGRAALRLGRRAEAIADFERALALNPGIVELRRYLELLKEEERPFETEHRLDAEEVIAAAEKVPLDPEVSTRVLLENVAVKVNRDGTASEFEQRVLRIENRDGIQENRWFSVPYAVGDQRATILRATLVRRSGRREEARIDNFSGGDGGGEFTTYSARGVQLPAAEVGDILVLERRVDDVRQSFFGDYFGKTHRFQGLEPVERSRFTLVAPESRELYFHAKNLDVEPVVRRVDGESVVVRIWEKRGVPRIEHEPHMPPAEEVAPSIQVSTFRDWNAFSRWYWNLVRKQFEPSDEMRAKVRELVAGKATREEKIRAVYDFVVTDVRYNDKWEFGVHGFKPYNASSIFTRRFGDCKDKATLIITMLGELGIPAYPVLIEGTSRRGREDYSLPLMEHFNHCIAYAPGPAPGGEDGWFLDGTAQHHEATNLPNMDWGARVLVVTPEGGELKSVRWPDPLRENGVVEAHKVALRPDGAATVDARIEPGGVYAASVRQAFENPGQRKEMLEQFYGRHFAGAKVAEHAFGDLRNLGEPVRVSFRMEVPRFWKQASGGFAVEEVPSVLFQWLFVEELSSWAAKSERKYDVVLPVPSGYEETIEYALPEGFTLKSTPPEAKVEGEFGTFVKRYEAQGRTLKVTRSLVLRAQRIPVARYQEWRAFANEVDRADDERAVLSKGGPEQ
jgi:tetratricopeptide (TPR) repeat protein